MGDADGLGLKGKGRRILGYLSEGAEGLRSVPALLHRNAKAFGDSPAYREKEFGIWQSWTWAEAAEEIEALAEDRSELWARIGAADFLSDEEKRVAAGYGVEG